MLQSKSIFLADDDDDDVDIFTYALNKACPACTLTVAQNGIDLINKLSSATSLPNLLFLDINMPMMNGFDTLRELRQNERLQTIPVVFYSTSKVDPDRRKALELGADYYLVKPTEPAILMQELQKLLDMDWSRKASSVEA